MNTKILRRQYSDRNRIYFNLYNHVVVEKNQETENNNTENNKSDSFWTEDYHVSER